jgi:hypothetical protein
MNRIAQPHHPADTPRTTDRLITCGWQLGRTFV